MFKYVVFLAGGKGSRLGKLTTVAPKALVKVSGRPLISYSLSQIKNIENKIITVGAHFERLVTYVAGFGVFTIVNTQNKGNCWWIFNSFIKTLNEPVLVLTCDLITEIDTEFLYNQYVRLGCPAITLIPTGPLPGLEGDFLHSDQNRVIAFSRLTKTGLFCTGIQVINPTKILRAIEGNYFPEDFGVLWKMLIVKREVFHSELYPHPWYSINTELELKSYEKISHKVLG